MASCTRLVEMALNLGCEGSEIWTWGFEVGVGDLHAGARAVLEFLT